MPVDSGKLRKVADHNDQVTEGIKAMSKQLEKLDPTKPDLTSAAVKAWARSVRELQASLEEQKGLCKEMRKSARIQDEQHGDSFRDKYRFLVGRLKADIRGLFTALQEFVELPQDFSNQRTWDHCVFDMETDIKHLSAINAGDTCLVNVEPIVMLLNYRDKVISLLLAGILFQASVLHWDLKSERAYADGPMVQMAEQVVHIFSKTESLPWKFHLSHSDNLPAAMEPGPFTYAVSEKAGTTTDVTAMQYRLLTVLREMQSLDKGLRNLRSSLQVHIPDKLPSGQSSVMGDILAEVQKWFERCNRLEQELSNSKEKRQTEFELQVEQLTAKCAEKDMLNKQQITKVHKLESDVQGWKYELTNLRREKSELAEKNAKMAKENLPVIDRLCSKSREAVDRLSKDCEMLSAMFRLQGQEKKKVLAQTEDTSRELEKVKWNLADVRENVRLKEGQLERKEALYLRTMAARKCIHEAYMEERKKISDAEEKMRQREADWQEMLKVVEGRDSEIQQLKGDLERARQRINELKQQRSMCMQAFYRATGKPGNSLLANFKASPTLPPPA